MLYQIRDEFGIVAETGLALDKALRLADTLAIETGGEFIVERTDGQFVRLFLG